MRFLAFGLAWIFIGWGLAFWSAPEIDKRPEDERLPLVLGMVGLWPFLALWSIFDEVSRLARKLVK